MITLLATLNPLCKDVFYVVFLGNYKKTPKSCRKSYAKFPAKEYVRIFKKNTILILKYLLVLILFIILIFWQFDELMLTVLFTLQIPLNDRKKKNFSFSRRFPFMKSKDQSGSEDISCDERKYCLHSVTRILGSCCTWLRSDIWTVG